MLAQSINVATLPKTDIHLHAETRARVDRMLSAREGRSAYDWPAWVRNLQQILPGMPRLEAIQGELEVPDLDRLAKCHFVEWVSDAMYDAAREASMSRRVLRSSAVGLSPRAPERAVQRWV